MSTTTKIKRVLKELEKSYQTNGIKRNRNNKRD